MAIIIVVSAYLFLMATVAQAGSEESVTVRALGNMRLRDAPSLQGERIAGIGWGEEAELLSVSDNGDWYQINYDGLIGWSSAAWFEVVSGDLDTRINAAAPSANQPTVAQAVGNVRIRQAPGLGASQVGLVPWGGLVTVLSVDSSGNWFEIAYDGMQGWSARGWYQVRSGDVGALVTEAGAGPAPSVPANARGLAAPIPARDTSTASSSTMTAVTDGTVAQALGTVRLRQGPGLRERQIGLVRWGAEVNVLGLDDSRQWLRVSYEGIVGWTFAEWYRITAGDPTVISGVGAPVQGEVTAQAVGNVRIRQGPSVGNARVGLVPWGTVVVVQDIDRSGNWYQISYDGITGWTFAPWYRIRSGEPGALR